MFFQFLIPSWCLWDPADSTTPYLGIISSFHDTCLSSLSLSCSLTYLPPNFIKFTITHFPSFIYFQLTTITHPHHLPLHHPKNYIWPPVLHLLALQEPPGFQDITPSGRFFHHWWLSSSPVVLPPLQAHTTHQAWAALGSSTPLLTPSVYLSPSSVSPWTAASPQRFHHCCSPTPLGNSFLIDLPPSIFSSSLIHLLHF